MQSSDFDVFDHLPEIPEADIDSGIVAALMNDHEIEEQAYRFMNAITADEFPFTNGSSPIVLPEMVENLSLSIDSDSSIRGDIEEMADSNDSVEVPRSFEEEKTSFSDSMEIPRGFEDDKETGDDLTRNSDLLTNPNNSMGILRGLEDMKLTVGYEADSSDSIEAARAFRDVMDIVYGVVEGDVLFSSVGERERGPEERRKAKLLEDCEKPSKRMPSLYPVWPIDDMSRDRQVWLAARSLSNVNTRPVCLEMTTSGLDTNDIAFLIEKGFDTTGSIPLQRTGFRVKCKNAVKNLQSLLKSFANAQNSVLGLRIENSPIMGEIRFKGSKRNRRMKTSLVANFCKVEKYGQELGMRFVAFFHCRSTMDRWRTMHISYYDEPRPNGERVTCVILQHEARNQQGVTFSNERSEVTFEVDAEEMIPTSKTKRPESDLLNAIFKLRRERISDDFRITN